MSKRITSLALAWIPILTGLAACVLPATEVTRPPQVATPAPAAKPAWQEKWDRTLQEAKKEGKLVVYTTYGNEWRQPLATAMSEKFGINLDAVTGRSAEVAERVMREQKSRINQVDLVNVGSSQFLMTFQPEGVLQPLEDKLILPEVVDAKAWWRGVLPWLDPDTKTYFQFAEYVTPPFTYNTDLVKPEQLKSWKDLLDPKWKGKIVINDPTTSGSGQKTMTVLAYGLMDWDFLTQLVKQEPVLQRDGRLMVEWVARGKYPIVIAPSPDVVFEFIKAGAPLKLAVPVEGTYLAASSGFISQAKGSPNPNAATIFINFLLTKEGQTIFSKAVGIQSSRVDVPTDGLEPIIVRQPGIKYISTTDKDFLEKEVELKNKVVDLFRPLLK